MKFFKNRPSIFSSYFWKDLKYDISCLFFPRNRWATEVIPRRFADKVELIKDFLFAAVVDFAEKEEGLYTDEEMAEIENFSWEPQEEVKKLYALIKDLSRQQEENTAKYKIDPDKDLLEQLNCPIRREKLKPVLAESQRLEELEQEICERIVKIRNYLWT